MALPLFLTRSAALKLAKGLSQRDTTIRDFVSGKNLKDTSRFTFKDKMTDEEKKLNEFIRRSTMTETIGKGNKK